MGRRSNRSEGFGSLEPLFYELKPFILVLLSLVALFRVPASTLAVTSGWALLLLTLMISSQRIYFRHFEKIKRK